MFLVYRRGVPDSYYAKSPHGTCYVYGDIIEAHHQTEILAKILAFTLVTVIVGEIIFSIVWFALDDPVRGNYYVDFAERFD